MTSSPKPMPAACRATEIATVPFATGNAYLAPCIAAKSSQKPLAKVVGRG